MNLRPQRPERCALANCATPRYNGLISNHILANSSNLVNGSFFRLHFTDVINVIKCGSMTQILESLPPIQAGDMTFVPWIPEDVIVARVIDMAGELALRYAGERLRVLPVLQGALQFSNLLVGHMLVQPVGPREIVVDPLRVKSYAGTASGELKWLQYPELACDTTVHDLVVEDIVDTGNTLPKVEAYLETRHLASRTTVVMLDRVDGRSSGVCYTPDMVGFDISDPGTWAIGMGLDLNEKYRELTTVYGKLGPNGELPPPYSLPDLSLPPLPGIL